MDQSAASLQEKIHRTLWHALAFCRWNYSNGIQRERFASCPFCSLGLDYLDDSKISKDFSEENESTYKLEKKARKNQVGFYASINLFEKSSFAHDWGRHPSTLKVNVAKDEKGVGTTGASCDI
ncbi:hypothetical protein HZH68_009800 [Vespula germanica]|uniref:Uncharacterized protein n=1 Tax=Vespula germanica TaxID=30212 RepID=A0A834N4S2_VESGE|nr:hypothetical protein HZH68_009800 [Vespula germanica]